MCGSASRSGSAPCSRRAAEVAGPIEAIRGPSSDPPARAKKRTDEADVIAHEVGHHVQTLRGTSDEVRRLQRENPDQANPLSVRQELQADCYAGVWAHAVFDQLDKGDVEEAITASEAVGDDRLQRRATGEVRPDSFTHGTSEQRAQWFQKGQSSGEPADCDTFSDDDV